MKDKKPFFYRIDAATFLLEVVTTPENERAQKFYQLALDMVAGKGTFPYSKQIIAEVKQFKEKKSAAGQKGMKNRWLRDNSVITKDNTVITKDDSVITRSSTEAVQQQGEKPAIPYKEIINDLNQKGGFRYTTCEATKRHINARFAEGFTEQDFFHVHTVKIKEWKGTDSAKYLRPETLYGNKFQGYVNQPILQNVCTTPSWY